VLAVAGPAGSATVDLTAVRTRIGAHPAYVRAVVDFTDGTLQFGEVEAIDHRAFDGSVRIRVRHRNVQAQAPAVSRAGVQAKVTGGRDRLDVVLTSARHRFKYVQVSTLHSPERLVLDLYRSAPPGAGAEIPVGRRGCLSLASVTAVSHGFRVRGSERDLFEHGFVLRVRDAGGVVVGRRIMTAAGPWSTTIGYRVTTRQAGTLEAVAESAKDGALDCIAQARVRLDP
jgi:hypothetical protein